MALRDRLIEAFAQRLGHEYPDIALSRYEAGFIYAKEERAEQIERDTEWDAAVERTWTREDSPPTPFTQQCCPYCKNGCFVVYTPAPENDIMKRHIELAHPERYKLAEKWDTSAFDPSGRS
jgi:hypothetical protein